MFVLRTICELMSRTSLMVYLVAIQKVESARIFILNKVPQAANNHSCYKVMHNCSPKKLHKLGPQKLYYAIVGAKELVDF